MKVIAGHLQERGTELPASGVFHVRDLGVESPIDPFAKSDYRIVPGREDDENAWYVISTGPDRAYEAERDPSRLIQYDPTNGTISRGDMRVPVRASREGP